MATSRAPEPKGDCCALCRFFLDIKVQGETADEPYGICRRFPPNRQRNNFYFPGVKVTDWCGEFHAKPGGGPPPLVGETLPSMPEAKPS
jgi:hypothetical protein